MTGLARLSALSRSAGGLFPPSVAVGAAFACDPALLWPEEKAAIARARPDRQREFAGGRTAARVALGRLGIIDQSIPMARDRAPVWPSGVQGSITHCGEICLAAASIDPEVLGLGLDIEPDLPLPSDLRDEVVFPDECHLDGRLVFSAKEAVFKALHRHVGFVFGFDAVRIATLGDRFIATTAMPLGPIRIGTRIVGRLARSGGYVITAVAI